MTTHSQTLALAMDRFQTGQLDDAERLCRAILQEDANHVDAWQILGLIAYRTGRGAWAVDCLRTALRLMPEFAEVHNNLANILMEQGNLDEAIAGYQEAIRLKPGYAEAHNNVGMALVKAGRCEEAAPSCRRALECRPDYAEAAVNLGHALKALGRWGEAEAAYRDAIARRPGYADGCCNLAMLFLTQGQLDDATAWYRQALAFDPRHAHAHHDLGVLCAKQGRWADAQSSYEQALFLKPDFAEAHSNLGIALAEMGRHEEAATSYRRALHFRPDLALAHNNLGIVLTELNRLEEAIDAFDNAIRLEPNFAEAHCSLSNALKGQGRMADALASCRRAHACKPDDSRFHSNLVFALWYTPDCDAAAIGAEHRLWNERHAAPLARFLQPHANDRAPDRRLRIGYVSPDFRDHVVGRNLAPLFREHDHRRFEIFCYANRNLTDDLTRRFQSWADGWRDVVGMSDADLAERIRADRIDILVDLTLHTDRQRLLVFARKPAPVQATFAGYPGTTGLAAIDYRLTDPYLEPPGAPADWGSEKPIRLPHTFWCYDPLDDGTAVGELPALANGHITFGCLNNFCKVNASVLALWAQVLRACPETHLILLAAEGRHRHDTLTLLNEHGVAAERVTFLAPRRRPTYLEMYHDIDIGLDTFPYNGHTTSLDALWMGVPVVTLVGKTVVGRAGLSQLTNLGLPELIAKAPDDFVRIAAALARDPVRLRGLRGGLRERMRASPLMDHQGFARGIEAAYVEMSQTWCRSPLAD